MTPLDDLASDDIFQYERQNLKQVRGVIRLRMATFKTMRERLFFLTEDI